MTKTKTREQWLNAAAAEIQKLHSESFLQHFGEKGSARLDNLLVSTGFPSRGGLSNVIGECWKAEASEGGAHHIFINPRLHSIVEVVATLAHEMVHAADNGEHSHKGPFVRCVRAMGLEGKPTSTEAGEEFAEWAKSLESKLGPYPHQLLTPLKTVKKQGTRMLKLEAPCCGYVVRTTQKWIDEGLPTCPCGNEFEEAS